MSVYICPVCKSKLSLKGNSYVCNNSHNFDISRSGYVNLLLSSSVNHGDDTEMVLSRRRFLQSGNYEPLRNALFDEVLKLKPKALLDAGCGEGYYTSFLKSLMPECEIYGVDVSKKAAEKAAKSDKSLNICVASVYAMPYADKSFECVINVFSPLATEEYLRVLKDNGYLVMAVPEKDHLIELKKALYDNVYIKEEKEPELNGFDLCTFRSVSYKMQLDNAQLTDLFMMTPYSHKTSNKDKEKLKEINNLCVTASFKLFTYKKHNYGN